MEELPPFEDDPQKWIVLWTRYPRQWAQLVKLLPLNDHDDEVDDLPDALVTCELWSLILDPGCGSFTIWSTLLRNVEVIASEVPPFSLERARELAAIDASQRRRAKKAGVSFLVAGVLAYQRLSAFLA